MRILSAIALVFVFTLAASFAQAATINVPADHTTIQDAINNAVAGDEIVISAGTYPETISLNKNVALSGAGIVDGTIDVSADGASIQDITVSPTTIFGSNEAGILIAANDVIIDNVTIDGITGDGSGWFTVKGIHIFSGSGISNIQLSNNEIRNIENLDDGNSSHYGGADGIMVQGAVDDIRVLNNTIEDVHSAGWVHAIEVTTSGSANGTVPTNILIEGNTVTKANDGSVYSVNPTSAPYRGNAVSIDAAKWGPADAGEVIVRQNNLLAPVGVVNKDEDGTLNAQSNWWGCENGPNSPDCSIAASGAGLGVIDYDPWLCEEARSDINSDVNSCNSINDGTINVLYYNENASWTLAQDSLRVWGQAPLGADSANVKLRLPDQTVVDTVSVPVETLVTNEQAYNAFFHDFSDYDWTKYQVVVEFLDDGVRMPGFNVVQNVDTLFIWQLSEDLNQTITDLEALNESVSEEFTQLQVVLDSMSQGTIEWRYFEESNTFEFQGEIPDVADFDPRFWIVDSEGDTVYQTTGTSDFIYGPHNPLHGDASFWKLVLDASVLDEGIHTVNLDFERGNTQDRWSVATITELSVIDLQSRVEELEETVKSIQGDMSLVWDGDEDRLRVKLFFPPGSTSARIYAYDSNDEQRFGPITVSDTGTPRQQDFDWNVSEWPIDSYTIKVNFLGSGDFSPWRSELFDNLLNRWLAENEYGFNLVESRTFEVWNPQNTFTRRISFGFTPEEDGEWRFSLRNTNLGPNGVETDISKDFGSTCYAINGKDTRVFESRNVQLPPVEEEYKVDLVARNCDTGETILSNGFRIEVVDLANPWPEAGVNTTLLETGNEQLASGIYWTNNQYVNLQGVFGSETEWENTYLGKPCQIGTIDSEGDAHATQSRLFDPESSYSCTWLSEDLLSGEWQAQEEEGSAPIYEFSVCGDPRNAQVMCDSVKIGYDTTAPVIDEDSLNPGVVDLVSGEWTFGANVSDDGEVMTVEFALINKTNATDMCNLGFANNTGGDTWELVYDTAGNCTPDGYYNFSVTATDFANNTAVLAIDPLIDNTAPVVQSVSLGGFLGNNMTIDAEVTDNLAGVLSANATVYRYTCGSPEGYEGEYPDLPLSCVSTCENPIPDVEFQQEVELTRTEGNSFSGTWSGSFEQEAGEQEAGYFYEVVVGATDGAGNEAEENSAERYARPSYEISMSVNDAQIFNNEQVTVQGIVTSSDGTSLTYDMITVEGTEVPIAGNDVFAANVGTFSVGEQTVTAVYEPKTVCNESFEGSITFTVEAAPNSGGGGGGGGYFAQPSTQGGDGEDPEPTPEQPEPETSNEGSGTPVQGSGNGDNSGSSEEPQEEPQPEPQEDNLLTGAVTGAGFFGDNWPWLALFGALVIALFGSYFYFRR